MPIIEVDDLNKEELKIYTKLSEVQRFHYYEPEIGIFIAESLKVIERAMNAGHEPISVLIEKKEFESHANIISRFKDIPIYVVETNVFEKIRGFQLIRGALCAMRRLELPSVEKVCEGARRVAVLENITNPTNIGAVFRSAAALNVEAVLLTSACSDPLYRRSVRVSMGTVFQIPWTYVNDINQLKKMGFKTAAMALCEESVSIDDKNLMSEEKLAIVLGNEGEGLLESTIKACDYTVMIPMTHGVDSLNVAAASAVAFWQLCSKK